MIGQRNVGPFAHLNIPESPVQCLKESITSRFWIRPLTVLALSTVPEYKSRIRRQSHKTLFTGKNEEIPLPLKLIFNCWIFDNVDDPAIEIRHRRYIVGFAD